MANEIKIHLRFNLQTGKKDIIIEYDSDSDALPYEHEERHWEIVEQLIGQGVLDPDEVGQLRVGKAEGGTNAAPQTVPVAEPQASGE